ncbi:MAG: hypothetical protein ACK41F_10080 [Fimbriimonadaceae bacterium]
MIDPAPIQLGEIAAGTKAVEATVWNVPSKPITALAIGGSSGCIEALEPEGRFDLQQGESRRVRFAFRQIVEGPIRQVLTVQSPWSPEPVGSAEIVGRVLLAFDPSDLPFAVKVRGTVEGEPFRAVWSGKLAFDGVVERVASFHQRGRHLAIAMEGAAAVECNIQGRTPAVRFEYVRSAVVDLSSEISVEPTAVWLGAVPPGSSRTAEFVLRGDGASLARVRLPAGTSVTLQGPRSMRISVPLQASLQPSLFSRRVSVVFDGREVCKLSVSGVARR